MDWKVYHTDYRVCTLNRTRSVDAGATNRPQRLETVGDSAVTGGARL